jgi:hypothetical protein
LARCARELDEYEQAAQHYQTAYAIRQALHERQPRVVERALNLITTQVNLSVTCLDRHTPAGDAEAARLLEEAERLLESLQAEGKLFAFEREYDIRIAAIRKNQGIIKRRAENRSDETDAGAGSGASN